jgi:hypothetical protein
MCCMGPPTVARSNGINPTNMLVIENSSTCRGCGFGWGVCMYRNRFALLPFVGQDIPVQQRPSRSLDRSVGEDRLSGCLLGGLVAPKCRWNELIARGRRRNSTVTQYSTTIPLVGNPSGVPGKSHVCSNADDTVPRSATVSFALDSLSDGVSSVQFTPSSTISPQEVESCSLG